MMDKSSKGAKKDVAKDAVQNDKVRSMTFHKMTVEELEEHFTTKIRNSDGRFFGLTDDQAAVVLE